MKISIFPRDESNGHYDVHLASRDAEGVIHEGRAYRIRGSKGDQVVFASVPHKRTEDTHEFPSVHSALHWIIATHIKEP